MLLQLEVVQYETSQFIDSTYVHTWMVHLRLSFLLSGDQNEVLKYLVLHILRTIAYGENLSPWAWSSA